MYFGTTAKWTLPFEMSTPFTMYLQCIFSLIGLYLIFRLLYFIFVKAFAWYEMHLNLKSIPGPTSKEELKFFFKVCKVVLGNRKNCPKGRKAKWSFLLKFVAFLNVETTVYFLILFFPFLAPKKSRTFSPRMHKNTAKSLVCLRPTRWCP